MIAPTVGRIVWYRPASGSDSAMTVVDHDQPLAALLAYVHRSGTMVNLMVTDHDGYRYARRNITLYQGEGPAPQRPYCEWMPYQKGQAAKTEATALELGAAVRRAGLQGP